MQTFPYETETMLYGFRVPVKILNQTTDGHGETIFEAEYIGEDNKCLDWGNKVFIKTGDKLKTRPMLVESARKWKLKGSWQIL